ncbi:MAG: DegT/DnrJ/EryC1/StrS family aminotransferase [Candidatus Margulisbacteria bacterium]|nr:DegT/DnrJ/EryC1/StrS family aminotransferase [Candidatus Margulisiibacteriota bacterium]
MKDFPYKNKSSEVYFFSYGRLALYAALKAMAIKPGENVLLPAYICNSVLSPFNALDIKVKYYLIDEKLNANIASIKQQIDDRTRAILVVNYFGFPQKLDEIKMICRERKLVCIEDNAHGFLSAESGQLLGTRGDIGILSFRKTISVPNGAALLINDATKLAEKIKPFIYKKTIDDEIRFFLRAVKIMFGKLAVPSQKIYREDPPEEENNFHKYMKQISFLTAKLYDKAELGRLARQKRERYSQLLKNIDRERAKPIFSDLPDGVVPMSLCVWVNGDREKYIRDTCVELGTRTYPWPSLPLDVQDKFADQMMLYKNLVCFPV